METRQTNRNHGGRSTAARSRVPVAALIPLLNLLVFSLPAQAPRGASLVASQYAFPFTLDRGSAGLQQILRKLHTRASLLMLTAHPDDEDGGMLAYESRGQGARAILLCFTRGEGGANVMSSDYFDALGLVRTEELLAADRYYVVEQFFGHVIDYGFSKFKEETLQKWNHDRVLSDAVRVVRLTRPLVVTSVFIGGPTDGHGNHQTTGQMMQEVFAAAGDPKAFPEQIRQGLQPWSPLKTYGRVPFSLLEGNLPAKGFFNTSTQTWDPAGAYDYVNKKYMPGPLSITVEVPQGTYDPAVGQSYTQVAREGLGLQKCQNGGGTIPPGGEVTSIYHRFGSRVSSGERETSFFDGIDVSLTGIAALAGSQDAGFLKQGLSEINALVEQAMREFPAQQPERLAPVLAAGLQSTRMLIQRVDASSLSAESKYDVLHELRIKEAQFNSAVLQALGLSMQATVVPEVVPEGRRGSPAGTPETFQVAIPGQKLNVQVQLNNPTPVPVQIGKVSLETGTGGNWSFSGDSLAGRSLTGNKPAVARFTVDVPADAGFTRPYYSRPDLEQPYYDINDARYLNLPQMPYPLSAWAGLEYQGVRLDLGQVVQSVKRITGPGTVLNPLLVGPAISVEISPHAGIVPLDAASFTVTAAIHSNIKGPAKGAVRLELPQGWTSVPPSAEFSTAKDGEDLSLAFEVHPRGLEQKTYKVTAVAQYGGREYREGYHTAGYPGLRPYNLYRASSYLTSGVDVKVAPGLTVAYVTGSGDDVPQALENLGVKAHFLTDLDLATSDLSRYSLVLLGVRTYAVRETLRTYNARFMDYVRNGGVVVVQYNTPEYDHNYGPYPYVMGRSPEEVTYEDSAVQILNPAHPLFNWPNKLTVRDFNEWVEERGSKFMQSWDPQYEALLETHDPNQSPQKGGLLYARYGKGIYVYCAYAFYRQLPEGVPGAYRIFANLLSLPSNPGARTTGAR